MNLPRRELLRLGSVAIGGLATGVSAAKGQASQGPRAKACILLFMDGGPSHIDLFDLKPQAPADVRGPWHPIATSVPGLQTSELLPRLAQQMHHVLQIRSVTHEQTVHDPAVYQMLTGYKHVSSAGDLKVEETDLPHIACAFHQADTTVQRMPKTVLIPERMTMGGRILPGQNSGILSPAFRSFEAPVTRGGAVIPPAFPDAREVSRPRWNERLSLREQLETHARGLEGELNAGRLDLFRQQALEIVSSQEVRRAFDLDAESVATRDAYGRHRHGQSVLLARRLVEAGTRFVTVYWGNEEQDWADGRGPRLANNPWDTHRNHFPLVKDDLVPRADQTLATLLSDLGERGMLDETLVVWMGDFGRTPYISRPWASRDHWPFAFTVLLAGAGVKAGSVLGATDRLAAQVTDHPVSPADLTATMLWALGVDPGQSVPAAHGKPHRLSLGRPLTECFA